MISVNGSQNRKILAATTLHFGVWCAGYQKNVHELMDFMDCEYLFHCLFVPTGVYLPTHTGECHRKMKQDNIVPANFTMKKIPTKQNQRCCEKGNQRTKEVIKYILPLWGEIDALAERLAFHGYNVGVYDGRTSKIEIRCVETTKTPRMY